MLIPSIDSLQIKYLQQNGTYKRSSKRIYEWVFFFNNPLYSYKNALYD